MPNIASKPNSCPSTIPDIDHSQLTLRMSDLTLLDHIVSQTRQNVELLISHNRLSRSDGRDILAKLPSTGAGSIISLTQQTQRLRMSPAPAQSVPIISDGSHVSSKAGGRAIWDWTSEVYHICTYVPRICLTHGRIQMIYRFMLEKS
jgi:hypothetical protein